MRDLVKDTTSRNLGKRMHRCRLCGVKGMYDTYLAKEMMQDSGEEFEYFACTECNCLQLAQIPQDLGSYYGKDYYSFAQKEFPDFHYETPVERRDKILDVGCGSGAWLFQKALSGYSNLYGCDPFLEKSLCYGDRVYIWNCSIHEIEGDGSFDVIRMWDSFEHMVDPLEALQSAARLLKPGGMLVMNIPVFPNVAFEMFGSHWFQIDAPRHIFLHSKKSLEHLEEESGLKIVKMEYDANNSMIIRSFLYSMGVPFYEQTQELIGKYFSEEDFREIEQNIHSWNLAEYGDHAKVYWIHQNV